MTYSSCIRHPEKTRYIQVYDWQIKFCQGNHCAALLLSFFINWHDWKLRNDQYYKRANDIAEMHGDGRPHGQDAFLFFTTEELISGCMEFYGKKAINEALALLTSLHVITTHKNPNPRYHFDKTKYFKFNPKVCNRWISDIYPLDDEEDNNLAQPVEFIDRSKIADRSGKNGVPSHQNGLPSGESCQAITNTTNNTTNNNQSINARQDLLNVDRIKSKQSDHPDPLPEITQIIDVLIAKGFLLDRSHHSDDMAVIEQLVQQGATVAIVDDAYAVSLKATSMRGKRFGLRYLAKTIEGMLSKVEKHRTETFSSANHSEPQYENDFRGGLHWMGDLVELPVQ